MTTQTTESSRATGKWSQPGVPHKGWTCTGIDDLGDLIGVCEMCETQQIRYVHQMCHLSYPKELGVGCICAGHMEADLVGAKRRESDFKNIASRRRNWLTRVWRKSRRGGVYVVADGFSIRVYPLPRDRNGSLWAADIYHKQSRKTWSSKREYRTEDLAKLATFEAMLERYPG